MQQNTYTHSTIFRETFSDNATRPRWYLRYSNTHLTYINWWKHWNKYIQTNHDKEQLKVKQKKCQFKNKTKPYEKEPLLISKLCTLSDEFEIPERKCDDNWKKSTQHTHILKVVETPPKPKGTQTHTHLEQLEPLLYYYNYSATLSPNIFTANR